MLNISSIALDALERMSKAMQLYKVDISGTNFFFTRPHYINLYL